MHAWAMGPCYEAGAGPGPPSPHTTHGHDTRYISLPRAVSVIQLGITIQIESPSMKGAQLLKLRSGAGCSRSPGLHPLATRPSRTLPGLFCLPSSRTLAPGRARPHAPCGSGSRNTKRGSDRNNSSGISSSSGGGGCPGPHKVDNTLQFYRGLLALLCVSLLWGSYGPAFKYLLSLPR